MVETKETKNGTNRFSNLLKNLFFLIIIIQILPALVGGIKDYIMHMLNPKTEVAGLRIRGPLYDATYYVKKIQKLLKDDDIEGLILKINCPGGAPAASHTIFSELKKFKEKKPIVVLIEDLGTSGAYYIAAAADIIMADKQSAVGSIGARMVVGNVKHFLLDYKVQADEIYAGKYKAAISWLKDRTAEETIYLQNFVEEGYRQFVEDIADARNLDIKNKAVWAEGKIFSGTQALKLKLVDRLGDFSDAKEEMKAQLEKRGIKPTDEIKVIFPKKNTGISRLIYGDYEDEQESMSDTCANFMTSVYKKMQSSLSSEEITRS